MKKIDAQMTRRYGFHALIFLVFAFLTIFIWRNGLSAISSYTDLSYHLATAQGFIRAEGVVTWDFWESLPLGRPHNYPPLFHLALASLLKFGLSPSVAAKLMMEITVVGGMAIYAWGINKLFGIKVVFWSVFLLACSLHFIQLSLSVMPATIVIFCSPALLYFAREGKWFSLGALLICCFYLHLFLPYIIVIGLLIYLIIFSKRLFWPSLATCLIAFLSFLPWLAHIFSGGWEYIKYFDSGSLAGMWKEYVSVNLILLLMAIFGFGRFLKRTREHNEYYFFGIIVILLLIPSFLMASRVVDGHLLPVAAVFAGLFLSECQKSNLKYISIPLALAYIFFTPVLVIDGGTRLSFQKSSPLVLFDSQETITGDPQEKFADAIKAINGRAKAGDTIVANLTSLDGRPVDKNYNLAISNIIGSYTNLSSLNLRSPEINRRPSPDFSKSKFFLSNNQIGDIASFRDFQLIAFLPSKIEGTPDAYLYYNPDSTYTVENTAKPKLPLWTGDSVLLLLIVIIFYNNQMYSRVTNRRT